MQNYLFSKKSIRAWSLILCLFITNISFAQIPTGYYDDAVGKSGNDLKNALNGIIKGHTEYPYSSSGTDVWDILKVADKDPNNSSNVIGIYSDFSMNAAAEYDGGAGWNREHVWAKSRGDFGTSKGAGTDLHHIRAADVSTNSARNNRNFDEAPTQYVDGSGNYQGTTDSYTSTTDWIWEPRDEVKGDVARMIFYMVVRYEGESGEPDLELTDVYLSSTDKSAFQGKASTLMSWHLVDPVSTAETDRNDVVYSYQGNRNPFIDHPEYACEIFSSYCSGGGSGNELFISEYIEGSSYNKALEIANTTGSSVNLSDYSLKKQTNGAGSWGSEYSLTGSLADGEVFVIAHSSAASAITSEADVTTTSGIVTFNGNDPIGLFKNGTLIDIVGTFNGGSSNFAQNVTKVRKATVTDPVTTYDSSEWDDEPSDSFGFLGSHNGSSGSGGSTSTASDLFFSEYIEGSSYNKALEIANFTGNNVDLSDYSIKKQTNGSGSWGTAYTLSGTLNDQDVYVIAHSSASSSVTTNADVTTSNSIITFNGNDPVGLFKNGTLIDIIGDFNGGSSNFAKDLTLVRKSSVDAPNSTYDSGEWDSHAQNTFGYLGSHTFGSSKKGHISIDRKQSELKLYPNPVMDILHFEEAVSGTVSIRDLSGRQILGQSDFSGEELDLSSLKSGQYLIFIVTSDRTYTEKIIKK